MQAAQNTSLLTLNKRKSHLKYKTPLITLVVVVALVGILALGINIINQQNRALPDVSLRTLEGESVHLEDFVGQPLVVNVWATWCPPCVREMPLLAQLDASHTEIKVLLVNHGEGETRISRFLQEQQLSLQHLLLDPMGGLLEHSGHRGLPVTYFYDAQGHLVATHSGELMPADLAEHLPRMGVAYE